MYCSRIPSDERVRDGDQGAHLGLGDWNGRRVPAETTPGSRGIPRDLRACCPRSPAFAPRGAICFDARGPGATRGSSCPSARCAGARPRTHGRFRTRPSLAIPPTLENSRVELRRRDAHDGPRLQGGLVKDAVNRGPLHGAPHDAGEELTADRLQFHSALLAPEGGRARNREHGCGEQAFEAPVTTTQPSRTSPYSPTPRLFDEQHPPPSCRFATNRKARRSRLDRQACDLVDHRAHRLEPVGDRAVIGAAGAPGRAPTPRGERAAAAGDRSRRVRRRRAAPGGPSRRSPHAIGARQPPLAQRRFLAGNLAPRSPKRPTRPPRQTCRLHTLHNHPCNRPPKPPPPRKKAPTPS